MTTTIAELMRHIADIVEDNPAMPVPTLHYDGRIDWYTAHTPDEVTAVQAAVGGDWTVSQPDGSEFGDTYAVHSTTAHGYELRVFIKRALVEA